MNVLYYSYTARIEECTIFMFVPETVVLNVSFMLTCIFCCQVSAYTHELFSVVLHGLDELGHLTAGIFSISQRDEVSTCT